jgi:protoporphyrinogen oxidase
MAAIENLIIGTGPAGLGAADAARAMNLEYLILEQNEMPFGRCGSFSVNDIYFDQGPHISFTKIEQVKTLFERNFPDFINVKPVMLNHWQGFVVPHPVQRHLAFLPAPLKDEVFNNIKARPQIEKPSNYEEWLIANFGKLFTKTFPEVYTRKYWTLQACEMAVDWIGDRISLPSIKEIEEGYLKKEQIFNEHYFTNFRYPASGGFQSFLQKTVDTHKEQIKYKTLVVRIDTKNKFVETANCGRFYFQRLFFSVPLDQMPKLLGQQNSSLETAAEKLLCSNVHLYSFVYFTNTRPQCNWGYVYNEDIPFARYYYPKSLVNKTHEVIQAVQVEVYSSRHFQPDHNLEKIIDGLERLNILDGTKIIKIDSRFIPYANVIFDHKRRENSEFLHKELTNMDLYGIGRYGHWRYLWSDESYIDGWNSVSKSNVIKK